MIDAHALNIFTDGSSYQKPRRGGMGVLYVWVDTSGLEQSEPLDQFGVQQATNNRMELVAVVRGLRGVQPFLHKRHFSRILVHTDSTYVAKYYKTAIYLWSRNRWCNRFGRPISNVDEWRDLLREMQKVRMQVDIVWARGKSDSYRKQADKLAKASASNPLEAPRSVVAVRPKLSLEMTDPQSVKMEGQRVTIYVVSSEYMSVQQTNKYRFKVMTKSSPYLGKISFLYSRELLKPRHCYYVHLNDVTENPTITRVFREVIRRPKRSADATPI